MTKGHVAAHLQVEGVPMMDRARAARTMAAHNLDGLVATTLENVAYSSGLHSCVSKPNHSTQIMAVIAQDPSIPVCLIVPTINLACAAQLGLPAEHVLPYGDFQFYLNSAAVVDGPSATLAAMIRPRPFETAVEAFAAALERLGLRPVRVGIDEMGVDPTTLGVLQSRVTSELVPSYTVFRWIRAIKSAPEVARLRRAAEIAEVAIRETLAVARPGVAHRDLVSEYRVAAQRLGAVPTHVNFRFGPDSGMPAILPSETKLQPGQFLAWDVGLVYDGYHADTARCAVIDPGAIDSRIVRYYQALVAGQQAAIGAIKPGVRVSDVFKRAVEVIRRTIPLYKRNHCGHGIGVEAYDDPLVTRSNHTVIETGMVLNIETPYYEIGFGSPVCEDTILVSDFGAEYLTTMDRKLLAL